jgi:hypothetical protein
LKLIAMSPASDPTASARKRRNGVWQRCIDPPLRNTAPMEKQRHACAARLSGRRRE